MTKDSRSYFYKSFFLMLISIAMQNVLVYSVNLADNVMLGRFSESAMSGVGLVNQIQFLLQMLVTGTGEGITVIASRHWGEGDTASVRRITSVGMRFALVFSGIIFVAAFFFPEAVLGILTNKHEYIVEGAKYLRIIAFTYPIFAISNILLASLRSVETTRIGLWISVVTLISNISLNYLLIFGKAGFPKMGVRGAAVATLISRVIELVIITLYTFLIDKKIRLRLGDFFSPVGEMLRRFAKTGLPCIFSSGSWGIAMGLQTAILGRLEESVVPANSIATTVFSIMTVFIYGSATAAAVALGKMLGENKALIAEGSLTAEENLAQVKSRTRTLQVIFLILGVAASVALFAVKGLVIGFYDISPETERLTNSFMCVLCVTLLGTAYEMPCLTGIIRAGGDTSFVFYNDLIFMWCIVLPSSFISAFVLKLSPVIVFACLKSDQVLKCAVAAVKVNRYRWIRDV